MKTNIVQRQFVLLRYAILYFISRLYTICIFFAIPFERIAAHLCSSSFSVTFREFLLVHRYQDTELRLIKCYPKPNEVAAASRDVAVTKARWIVVAVVAVTATAIRARITRVGGIFQCPLPYVSC